MPSKLPKFQRVRSHLQHLAQAVLLGTWFDAFVISPYQLATSTADFGKFVPPRSIPQVNLAKLCYCRQATTIGTPCHLGGAVTEVKRHQVLTTLGRQHLDRAIGRRRNDPSAVGTPGQVVDSRAVQSRAKADLAGWHIHRFDQPVSAASDQCFSAWTP